MRPSCLAHARLRHLLAAALIFAPGLGLALLPAGPAGAAQRIKITTPVASLTATSLYLAKARGLFSEEGLDVEIVVTGGTGPDVKAMLAGDAEFAYTPGNMIFVMYQQGQPTLGLMAGLSRCIINWAIHRDVALAKGITEETPLEQKLRALQGLTVGPTLSGALTWHLAEYVVRRAGYVPQKDVRIIPAGSGPAMLAALEHRKVDIILMSTPIPETAVHRGMALMFLNNAKGEDPALPEFMMVDLLTRPDTVRKSPDLVRRATRAFVRANRWAVEHTPEEVREALRAQFPRIDAQVLLAGIQTVKSAIPADGRITERSVQVTQDVLEQAGLLKTRVPYSAVINNDFLPRP
ncbi:MAG: ABC transporter substrate-binding protein [Deltaproteobacteria bacterium]|nr:ABC transporter substrate-binding protein [Deltaproteobacteria bacterium]